MEERYQRQTMLPEIGATGQKKLSKAHVLVVGAGGLGCPALTYIASAGVGRITIVDADIISETNLNRQVLYGSKDIGRFKVEIAKSKLTEQNPTLKVNAINEEINLSNCNELVKKASVVLDCTDNVATRYLLSDACQLNKKPLVYAGIHRFQGQLTVFHYRQGISYRDMFPYDPNKTPPNSCDENGVLGVVPGVLGTLQANEAIKIISGFGDVLDGKMMILNLLNLQSQIFSINKEANRVVVSKLEDRPEYGHLCNNSPVAHLSVSEFLSLDKEQVALIDIRDESELPKSTYSTAQETEIINKDIVLLCQTGKRSTNAVPAWEAKYSGRKVYTLDGGVLALNEELKRI